MKTKVCLSVPGQYVLSLDRKAEQNVPVPFESICLTNNNFLILDDYFVMFRCYFALL